MALSAWKKIGFQFLKMIILLLVISVLSFTLVEISPIDPVTAYVGGDSMATKEHREQIAEKWGLNEPASTRFFKWMGNILHGDFGTSQIYGRPVLNIIGEKFKASLVLMGVAWVVSGLFGFLLGVLAAAYKGSILDKIVKVYCLVLQSSPAFWIGMVCLLFFSVYLGWFPIGLAAPIGKTAAEVTLGDRIYHMVLPAFVLSLTGISNIALQTREKLIQVIESDFALFARSRGERLWTFIRRHGIRNILLPAVTLQFGTLSELFGGSVLAENVFSYPGLGATTTQAGMSADIPLLLGITIFSAVFVFTGNMIANLLYPIIDPRIREGGRL